MKSACGMMMLAVLVTAVGCAGNGQDVLPEEQAAAVQSVARQTETLALVTGAASYGRRVDELMPGAPREAIGAQLECPNIDITVDLETLSVIALIDFGTGCSPQLYPAVTLSGSLRGQVVSPAPGTSALGVNLTLDELTAGVHAISGTVDVTFERNDSTVEFNGELQLDSSEGESLALTAATWTLDLDTGVISFSLAQGTAENAQGTVYQVTYEDLVIDGQSNISFIPESGTATIILPNDSGVFGAGSTSIVMTFTEESPSTGVVLLSINGGTEFEYQTQLPAGE